MKLFLFNQNNQTAFTKMFSLVLGMFLFSFTANACDVELTIKNNGNCEIELYHWVTDGDIFISNVAAGQTYTVTTQDGEMWRTKIGEWGSLEFDKSYAVDGCEPQSFNISPCGSFNATPECQTDCSSINTNINGYEYLGTFQGHAYYKRTDGDVKFWDAMAYANDLGGYLATIGSQAENDWLREAAGSTGNYWIGLADVDYEGSWYWENGEALTYTNWAANEPNNSGGNENFAHVNTNGQWNDVNNDNYNWTIVEVVCPCTSVPGMQPACTLDVDAGSNQSICAGETITLTSSTSGESDCSCCTREVANTVNCNNAAIYGFYLKETDGGAHHFTLSSATFTECAGGTANYTGVATGTNGDEVTIDISFAGATNTTPDELSPKDNNCGDVNTSDWTYYPITTGTFTSAQHGTFEITRRGASFQIGDGANATSLGFGASGWFEIVNGNGFYSIGDVNIMLGPLACPAVEAEVSYSWSNGATTQSIEVNPTSNQTYTVTVTDCQGCTATDEVAVNVTNETATASNDGPLNCDNPTAILSGSSSFNGVVTYSWSGPNGFSSDMQNPTTIDPGTYTLTVSKDGCSATAMTTVAGDSEDGCEYDLALIKILGPGQSSLVQIGETVQFIVKVTNQGAINSGDFTVMDRLPSGMTFVSANNGGTHNNSVVTWDLSNLAEGEAIELAVEANVTALGTGKYVNWAEISADSGDDEDSTPDPNTGIDFTEPNDLVNNHNDMMLDNAPNDEDDNDFEEVFVDRGSRLAPRAMLQGAMMNNGGGDLMRDNLRTDDLIPATDPYLGMSNFEHVGYNGGETVEDGVFNITGDNAIVDWMFIELRDKNNPEQIVATASALLQRDGDIVNVDGVSEVTFPNVEEDYYHVVMRHRNHLGTMTQTPIYLSKDYAAAADFTTIDTYGLFAQHEMNDGHQALWAGDNQGSGQIIFQGANNNPNQIFFEVLGANDNTDAQTNFIYTGYSDCDQDMNCQVIYQGVNNDTNYNFFNVVTHPANINFLTNFIIDAKLP